MAPVARFIASTKTPSGCAAPQDALRSRQIEILHVHDAIFGHGGLPRHTWREIFNSDATAYGGDGVGNFSADLVGGDGSFACVIPANGFVVFQAV